MKWKNTAKIMSLGLEAGALRLFSQEASRKHIIHKLSEIPGVPAKIAQFLNGRVESRSRQILHQKKQMSVESVLELIESRFPDLFGDLLEMDETPEVASLSQVHSAQLRTGERVAIKVQFPDIRREIESQLDEYFELFIRFGPSRGISIDLDHFQRFFRDSLLQELDYRHESQMQLQFFNFFKDKDWISVPNVFERYGFDGLMVQEFLPSAKVDRLIKADGYRQIRFSEDLVRFQLEAIFRMNVFHGDLHAANWGYDLTNSRLVIYDFGSTQDLPCKFIQSLRELLTTESMVPSDHLLLWSRLGFNPELLSKIKDVLPELSFMMTEPFRSRSWSSKDWDFSHRIGALLGDSRWDFRLAGPPWFLGLMRSFHGLISSLNVLGAPIDMTTILNETADLAIPSVSFKGQTTEPCLSKWLKVEVNENGRAVVELQFPSFSAASLSQLIPKEVGDRILQAGISLQSISRKAIDSDYLAQELYSGSSGSRHYRIWLE